MEKTPWTEEQRKVIDIRNGNLLVSAAAGSGKTAVLVERILSMITDRSAPLDIDRLLVVTFTNAAASEMRERIGRRIEEYMEQMPENEHLQKQSTLVHTASITTIDSFCMRMLREHFDETELDPSFRIGDEGEQKLLRSDVAEALLEDYYREGSQEFLHFVESYSTGKTDEGLEELIEKLYEFSMSYPEPELWLDSALKQYEAASMEEWEQTEAAKFLIRYLARMLTDCEQRLQTALRICKEAGGPFMYETALVSDLEQFDDISQDVGYAELGVRLRAISFVRLSAKKADEVLAEKREQVKLIRDSVKEDIKTLLKQFYSKPAEEIFADMQGVRQPLSILLALTKEFLRRYAKKKREKNLIDFHDVEHFALGLLAQKNEAGEWIPTKTAKEYREQFAQIMIDEYQDSNLVQEVILTSISGISEGKPNVFMVGDVKQSIYKFRLARPELFMEKYNSYSLEDGEYQRIDLHKNFRSRGEVLDSVNGIFHYIMTKQLGKIRYDEKEELYKGADFKPKPETEKRLEEENGQPECKLSDAENMTELYLIERRADDERISEFTAGELEAKLIADQIRKLTGENGLLVWDKEKNEYRSTCYGDIVILLRSMSGYADDFLSVFSEEGIPAHAQSQNGYFSAKEVQTVLNFLRVLDNPRQDVPLFGVMTSPLGGFRPADLAELRIGFSDGSLYDSLQACVQKREGPLSDKVRQFMEGFGRMRGMAAYTPIHELIRVVIRETGYGDYIMAMPSGQKRKLNLDMLIEKAYAFENTSYRGLFQFLRYIEKLNKYEVDYGEASAAGENENAVRIMSIHKSKGLEFPVVFLAGLGRRFNQQDTTDKIVLHPDMGVGADWVDYENRTRSVTLVKRILQKSLRLENLAEELRVLYVAMTRAKEKLIMTGTVADAKKQTVDWEMDALVRAGETLAYGTIAGASSYLDWIMPSYQSRKSENEKEEKKKDIFKLSQTDVPKVLEAEVLRQKDQLDCYESLRTWDMDRIFDLPTREEIEEHFSCQYPYPADVLLHGKVSVSEIKKRSQRLEAEETQESEALIEEEPPLLPEFIHGKQEKGGAARGTLYHRVLERIDVAQTDTREDIDRQLDAMEREKQLSGEERAQINSRKLWKFFSGSAGKRMKQAEKEGHLYREQPFVLGRKAGDFYPDTESEELILLQGMIDVYFEENGELVLLDYKTDYVGDQGEELLRRRYYIQFDCYRQALEQITGKKVKEMILYSFALEKESSM